MKRVTLTVAAALLALTISGIPAAQAQKPTPSPTPYAKQKLRPKATMKGVGTEKVAKGTKNALRKTGGAIGQNSRRVKKSLSENIRNLQKTVSGQNQKKKDTEPTKP